MLNKIGLYYPYIHFQDDDWLKVAALYWPNMGRIVPPGFELHDSDVVRALAGELGFIVNVAPGPAASKLTTVLIDAVTRHADEFRDMYRVSPDARLMETNVAPIGIPRSGWGINWSVSRSPESKAAADVVGLHSSKGEDRLWALLEESGLAVRYGAWWGLHPELAWLYTCALADKLAVQNKLVPTTDQPTAHIENLGWSDDDFVAALLGFNPQPDTADWDIYDDSAITTVGELALRLVVPADVSSVPIKKIIEIRQRYGADFDAFHDEVAVVASDLRNQLGEIDDPVVLETYLNNVVQSKFQQPVHALQKALHGVRVETSYAALSTKVELPASAALFGGLLTANPLVALGGAIAFGTARLLRNYTQGRTRELHPSAASYLWRVDKGINPQNLLARLFSRLIF